VRGEQRGWGGEAEEGPPGLAGEGRGGEERRVGEGRRPGRSGGQEGAAVDLREER